MEPRPQAFEDEPTILMVGDDEPLEEALVSAMERHGLSVERCAVVGSAQAAIAVAPDLVLLVGDAAADGGTDVLGRLSASPLAAVVPVVLLADDERLHDRLRAFRFGATAVVPRSASADAIATKVFELAREIPERSGETSGELGEATLEEFAGLLTRELKNGILSVKSGARRDDETQVRIVLGEGRTVANLVESFVSKVRPLVRSAEVVHYEFQEQPGGTLQLLGADTEDGDESPGSVAGMRVLLADDDVARADAVAEELRARGASVVMTDLAGERLERARTLDPEVLVIDQTAIEGEGYKLVRRMREDVRLRWAFLLVVSWDEIWSEASRGPVVNKLVRRIAQLGEPERSIRDRARAGIPFDTRLEATGPARLLRTLTDTQQTLRVTIHGRRAQVHVDMTEGLVAGAACNVVEGQGEYVEGPAALAAMLGVARGRVHVEPVLSPAFANVMSTIDFALNSASGEQAPFRPSEPVRKPYAMSTGAASTVGSTRLTPVSGSPRDMIMAPQSNPEKALPPRTDNTKQGIALPGARDADKPVTAEVKMPILDSSMRERMGKASRPGQAAAPRPPAPKPPAPGKPPPPKPPVKKSSVIPPPKVTLAGVGKRPSRPPPRPPGPKRASEPPPRPPSKPPSRPPSRPPGPRSARRKMTLVGMPMPEAAKKKQKEQQNKRSFGGLGPPPDAPAATAATADKLEGGKTQEMQVPPVAPEPPTTEVDMPAGDVAEPLPPLEDAPTQTAAPALSDDDGDLEGEPTRAATATAPLDDEPTQASARALPDDDFDPLESAPTQAAATAPLETAPTQAAATAPLETAPTQAAATAPELSPLEAAPTQASMAAAPDPLERETQSDSIDPLGITMPEAPAPPPVPDSIPEPRLPADYQPSIEVDGPIPTPVLNLGPAAPAPPAHDPFDARPVTPDATYKLGAVQNQKSRLAWILAGAILLLATVGVVIGIVLFDDDDEMIAVELEGEPNGDRTTPADPTEPAGEEPTEPSGEEPTEPSGEEPTEPSGEEPTEPSGEEPTEPEEPEEPAAHAGLTYDHPALPDVSTEIELPNVPRRVERMRPRAKRIQARRLRARGRRAHNRRRYRQARNLFRQSMIYQADSSAAAKGMCLALFRSNRPDESLAWLRRAIQLEPEDADLWVLLGDALGARRDIPGARAAWERAVEIDSRHRAARRRLERLNRRAGRTSMMR